MKYKGQDYLVEILDTAGQDEFSIMSQKHLVGIHGYIFAYSVASHASFDSLDIIRDKILNSLGGDHIPGVMVGNKTDLHIQRQVTEQEAKDKAKEMNVAFIETSARHNENIYKAFELVLGEIEKTQNPAQPEQKGCIIS